MPNLSGASRTLDREDRAMSVSLVGDESSANSDGASVVVHPSARISSTALIGKPCLRLREDEWRGPDRPTTIAANCDIGAFCVVGTGASIGARSILDSYSLIGCGATIGRDVLLTHRASIGAGAEIDDQCVIGGLIAEGSKIGKACRVFGDLISRQLDPTKPWYASEFVGDAPILNDGVFVGWGATVIGGVTVGSGTYICAGATVTQNVPGGGIVKGINEFCKPNDWKGPLGKSERFAVGKESKARKNGRRQVTLTAAQLLDERASYTDHSS